MLSLFGPACAVCFGDPSSWMSRGAFYGVLALMAVVGFVLGGIAYTALVWARRAKSLALPEKPA